MVPNVRFRLKREYAVTRRSPRYTESVTSRSRPCTALRKLRISSIALQMKTARKLSPYFIPWQIPATMAYTFFNTEAYSIPVTSLQQELFRYWFLNTEEKALAF